MGEFPRATQLESHVAGRPCRPFHRLRRPLSMEHRLATMKSRSFGGSVLFLSFAFGCAGGPATEVPSKPVSLKYTGSSTVGLFVADAENVYGRARFTIDTSGESAGGEQAVLTGATDVGGTARAPSSEVLKGDVVATLLGRDAITVIVRDDLPVTNLSRGALRDVFTGRTKNWKELGGPDLPIRPLIVAESSATRAVFRSAILGAEDFAGCDVVTPDPAMPDAVAKEPGAIGTISLAFLEHASRVRALAVDGQLPTPSNFDYPISRPLYLLWRQGQSAARAFADWAESDEGQRVLMRRFVSFRVVASVKPQTDTRAAGTLIVNTLTEEVRDGDVSYFPHVAYEVLTRDGTFVKRVENKASRIDERPTKISLPPGTYVVRTVGKNGRTVELFVTVESGATVTADVEQIGTTRER